MILLAYAAAQWIDAPRGRGRRRHEPAGLRSPRRRSCARRRAVFGAVPSVWLQERLVDGSAHWYDAAAALVYVTHFVSIPLVTAFVWFCLRDRFTAWVAAVLRSLLGVGVYVVYPAAPPWLASDLGDIGTVDRISAPAGTTSTWTWSEA